MRVIVMPEGKDPDDIIREDVNTWRSLTNQAVPLMDFMFAKTTAKLDLTTARDKSRAVDRLLPIVATLNDPVRQAHYLQKLAGLVKVDMNTIKASLSRLKPFPKGRTAKPITITQAAHPLASTSREEYCLAFLLQNPEFKNRQIEIIPAYFESSENREIFVAWQKTDTIQALKEYLDSNIHDHLDNLSRRILPQANLEKRYNHCVKELKKQYYRDFEAKRGEILALEVQEKGKEADIAKLKEEGMEPSKQLNIIFSQSNQKRNTSYSGRTRR
jgi:DNA primase